MKSVIFWLVIIVVAISGYAGFGIGKSSGRLKAAPNLPEFPVARLYERDPIMKYGTTVYAVLFYGFLEKMMNSIQSEFEADPRRFYLLGVSNGGMMAFRLGCNLSERFAVESIPATCVTAEPYDSLPDQARCPEPTNENVRAGMDLVWDFFSRYQRSP